MGRLEPAVLLVALAGCHDPVTEVVVVIESDLSIPAEADRVDTSFAFGSAPPFNGNPGTTTVVTSLEGRRFPISVGFTSRGSMPNFSTTVQVLHGIDEGGQPNNEVSRTVTDIRFVHQETMMLVLQLLRVCACDGTSCAITDNPDCASLRNPTLQPFDPVVAGTGFPP